jgi:hypothetical protein
VARVLYFDMRGDLEAKIWNKDGFTQDLQGRDSSRFKPQLPEEFKFPITDVLPSKD